MRIINGFFSNIHRYLFWLVISFVVWAWIFTLITDAPRAKKVVVFSNTPATRDTELAVELEKELPDGIRTIKVHPFSYSAFDTGAPDLADIYILTEKDIRENLHMLCPIEPSSEKDLVIDGCCYGLMLYDHETKSGAAGSFFGYYPEDALPDGAVLIDDNAAASAELGDPASYYISFNKNSPHLGKLNDSKDEAAILVADHIMKLP